MPRGVAVLTALLIITGLAATPATVSAVEPLPVSATWPSDPKAGQSSTISASIDLSSITFGSDQDLTVTLDVDESQVATKTISTSGGETISVNFTYTFPAAGSYDVTVSGNVTGPLGTTYEGSVSTTLDVSLPTVNRSGAAFPVPPQIKDEIESFRSNLGIDSSLQAFLLADQNNVTVVFASSTPPTAPATVSGELLGSKTTISGVTVDAIVANSVSSNTTAVNTTVSEITGTPDRFAFKRVRLSARHRRVTTLFDPDAGANVTVPTSVGVLTNASDSEPVFGPRFGGQVHNVTVGLANGSRNVSGLLSVPNALPTVGFDRGFWADANATVAGTVIPANASIRQVFASAIPANESLIEPTPVLYVTDRQLHPRRVASISDLATVKSGTVVAVNASIATGRFSTQEAAEEYTTCGNDLLNINPKQAEPVCVDVVADVLLHAGVGWSGSAISLNGTVPVLGASNHHQDQVLTAAVRGEYRLTGVVLQTDSVSTELDTGPVLVIYAADRLGSADLPVFNTTTAARNVSAPVIEQANTTSTSAPPVTLGDVNGDGSINTGDVIQVQRSIVGLSTGSEFTPAAADVTNDGSLNTGDVIQIQRKIVGLSTVF